MNKFLIHRRNLMLACAASWLSSPAWASNFPQQDKPIRLLVGYPAGGGTDVQARQLAQWLSPILGVPIVVENKPGAGTMMAANELLRSSPDGHTLLYTPVTTVAQLPHTLAAAKYDTFKDFTPVVQCAQGPNVLLVHRSIPATNAEELAAYGKKHPGQMNYVSQGVGTSAHIFGQMLAKQLGIEMVHVPYKGANDVAKDLVAGRVHLQFASSSAATALEKTGEIRLLGIVGAQRSALFTHLPTMGELGVSHMDIDTTLGVLGPAQMHPDAVQKISDGVRQVMALDKVKADFAKGGVTPEWRDSKAFGESIANTYRSWEHMVAAIGYTKE